MIFGRIFIAVIRKIFKGFFKDEISTYINT